MANQKNLLRKILKNGNLKAFTVKARKDVFLIIAQSERKPGAPSVHWNLFQAYQAEQVNIIFVCE